MMLASKNSLPLMFTNFSALGGSKILKTFKIHLNWATFSCPLRFKSHAMALRMVFDHSIK